MQQKQMISASAEQAAIARKGRSRDVITSIPGGLERSFYSLPDAAAIAVAGKGWCSHHLGFRISRLAAGEKTIANHAA
jgi:hypothetical protein